MKQNKFILLQILVLFAVKKLSRFLGRRVTKGGSVQVFVCLLDQPKQPRLVLSQAVVLAVGLR